MQIKTIEEAIKELSLNNYSKVKYFCNNYLKQYPGDKTAIYLLAGSLWGLDEFEEALVNINKLIAKDQYNHQYLQLRGIIYKSLLEYDKAIVDLNNSLKLNPNSPDTHNSLGATFAMDGDEEKSISHLKKAVELNPKFEVAWNGLAKTRKYNFTELDIKTLQNNLLDKNITPQQKYLFNNTLGIVYDHKKEYETAFKYFRAANLIAGVNTNTKALYKELQDCIIFFNDNYLTKNKLIGNNKVSPIFIVGMPRSGTTLAEQLISFYDNVKACGERNTLNKYINDFSQECKTVNTTQSGPIAINIEIPIPYPKCLEKLTQNKLDVWIAEYLKPLEQAISENNKVQLITDKMPFNYKYIPLILMMFPKAKIIHCVRNPLDTCLSCYMQPFAKSMLTFTNDLTTLGEYYKNYSDLMSHYNKIFSNKIYNLNYEALIENPKIEAKKLIEYCGLTWDPRCLEFYSNNKNKVSTASQWQVRSPIYKSSVNKSEYYKSFLGSLNL